jgi:hypothetical protein
MVDFKNVTISEYKVWVEDIAIPLIGGEVHYWRLAPENWRKILERVRELNLEVISTYVCWDFHEYSPGVYDFSGKTHPQRNLTGFLDLLTEMGFWIIIRPGPYIYTEWTNAGVPDDAARNHRLHPEFLNLAERYLEAVVPVLLPYLATNGGRIILLQADNEIDPWHQWHTESLGLGQGPGLFHEYLNEQYADVADLNRTWSTDYGSLNEARAVMYLPAGRGELFPRYLDFCRFKHWFVRKAAQWMVDTYQTLGVDIPIYLNTYAHVSVQPWNDLEKIAAIAGPDLYPTNEFVGRNDEHRVFMDSVRYARSYSRLPYIPEFESGIWHGWHYEVGALGGNHYRLMCLSALAAGIVGWSWYMLVNRDNWYMAPINEWGRFRPELYNVFRTIVDIFQEIDPTSAVQLTNTSVVFDTFQQAVFQPGQELLSALYQADIDYGFYDLQNNSQTPALLFYNGGSRLSKESQKRLRQYIDDGVHLICLGSYPCFDEYSRPVNLLEIPEPDGIIGDVPESIKIEINTGIDQVTVSTSWLAYYTDIPEVGIHATRLTGETISAEELNLILSLVEGEVYTVGFTREWEQGKLTVINIAPSDRLVRAVHQMAAVNVPTSSTTPGIHTTLYSRDDFLFVIAINNSYEDKSAIIKLDPDRVEACDYQVSDLVSGETWIAEHLKIQPLNVNIPRKDATVLKLSPISGN